MFAVLSCGKILFLRRRKNMKKKTRLFNVLIIAALFLGACNLPTGDEGQTASITAAAQTVEALLSATPASIVIIPSSTVPPVPPTLTTVPPPVNTNTPQATATSNCNVGQFVTDVTIPDGTIMPPGQAFVKKWRIKNIGSCAWSGFSLVFDSGDSMGAPATKAISDLGPGQEIDLEVALTSPATAGNYRGYFRINTNGGVTIPIIQGSNGKTFYVDIKVQIPVTATFTLPAPVVFAVTSVTYNVSGTCGNFHVSANITTSAAGTVKFFWQANGSDDFEGTYGSTLVFGAAGTQTTPTIDWAISAAGSHYLRVYIDEPNHQFIGQSSNMVCP